MKIKTITMYLKVKDKKLFKNYNKIWKNIEKLMDIDFNIKPTYDDDDKYIKIKKKHMETILIQIFIIKKGLKKYQKKNVPNKYLSIIILDSILYAYEKYHPQIFLEECKYAKGNMKTKNYIDKELKSESDKDSDNDSGTNNEE